MKKELVVAMAMAMGVTASAYAANPFSDVPAGHWAYDSISKLESAGVIDGYGATFGGEKLMTRYEMAQIVAKAMAKGANCDKLAAEFADELDNLGVRVAKLEKKVDNVKITGNIRYSYRDNVSGKGLDGKKLSGRAGKGYNRFRSRLFVSGQINDNWKYTGMLENDRYFDVDKTGNDHIKLKRAFVNGRVGGIKVEGGRVCALQSDMIDANADGLKASYNFDNVTISGWVLKNVESANIFKTDSDGDRFYMFKVDGKVKDLGIFAQYWKADNDGKLVHYNRIGHKVENTDIYELGLNYCFGKGFKANAQYYYGKNDNLNDKLDKSGYELGVSYLGAKASKPGSWGAWVTYANRPATTYLKPTIFNTYAYKEFDAWLFEDGYKGFEIGANLNITENIIATARYFVIEGRENTLENDFQGKAKRNTLWADVTFTF